MMRVYFSPCGIGFGHAGRCATIARKLMEELDDVEVLFSTYMEGVHLVKREGFPLARAPPVYLKTKPDGTIDLERTLLKPDLFLSMPRILNQVTNEIKFMKQFKPDVVVSDSRASSLLAAELLGIPRMCILNQFQIIIPREKRFLRLSKIADAGVLALVGKIWTLGPVLVPDFPPPYTISIHNLRMPRRYKRKVRLVGPLVPKRPEELPSQEKLKEALGLDVDRPLIFAPISGPLRERAFLIGALRGIFKRFPDDYQVVMSMGYLNAQPELLKNSKNFRLYRWVKNRFEYLKACDLVIARAGHETIMHSLCYGKPLILIPTPSHTEQMNNAERAKEIGAAEVLRQKDLNRKTLLKAVNEILGNHEYRRVAKKIEAFSSKLNALEAVVQEILELYQGT